MRTNVKIFTPYQDVSDPIMTFKTLVNDVGFKVNHMELKAPKSIFESRNTCWSKVLNFMNFLYLLMTPNSRYVQGNKWFYRKDAC